MWPGTGFPAAKNDVNVITIISASSRICLELIPCPGLSTVHPLSVVLTPWRKVKSLCSLHTYRSKVSRGNSLPSSHGREAQEVGLEASSSKDWRCCLQPLQCSEPDQAFGMETRLEEEKLGTERPNRRCLICSVLAIIGD